MGGAHSTWKEGKSVQGFCGEIQRKEMPGRYRWDDDTNTDPRDRIGGHRLD